MITSKIQKQLKKHRHTHLVQFAPSYHLKNLSKSLLNILDMDLIQNLLLSIEIFLFH